MLRLPGLYSPSLLNRVPQVQGQRRQVCAASSASTINVKICGVTSPDDAQFAVESGANFVGFIMWPHSKRSIDIQVAADISKRVHDQGASSVGVFVDESAALIEEKAAAANLSYVQLHGDIARSALPDLSASVKVIYVLQATPDGVIQTPLPSHLLGGNNQRKPDFLLLDSLQGGSGIALDWEALSVPDGESSQGWFLAGGLKAENVSNAISIARPSGVDVSSGVCCNDGLKKDKIKVGLFVKNAKNI